MTAKTGLCWTWQETLKTVFHASQLICRCNRFCTVDLKKKPGGLRALGGRVIVLS